MKKSLLLGCIVFFVGCFNSISKEDLTQLNGYWEIEQVVFSDGETKEYNVNTTIDYIQVEGVKGFRKKVTPKFDGTYQTSDDVEEFVISESDGDFTINYQTELSEWSETLTALGVDTFSVVNEEGKRYEYKRFQPITIEK